MTRKSAVFGRVFPTARQARISLGASSLMYRGLEASESKMLILTYGQTAPDLSLRCLEGTYRQTVRMWQSNKDDCRTMLRGSVIVSSSP